MPELTRLDLLNVVQQSGLVDEERLSRFLESQPEDLDASQVAAGLVEAGLLTPWHRDRLLEGKWKGFFLGKYKILYPLGAGAMGSVFLAEHKVMRHRVAIKVLARRLVARPNNILRFEREARAAAAINHPNVVRAYDIDREGDTHYLVMEYVQGENLQRLVQVGGPLEPNLAAEYIRQAAKGLHEAHRAGLVHRDIKPANILLDETGQVKILDLGLARMEDDSIPSVTLMNDSKLIGTVDYLAPEQALNSHAIDGRADLYSLGCTLYFLLTGSPPFPRGSLTERILKHQTRRPVDIRKRRPGVPDGLVNLCNRMMEKLPSARFATAAEVAAALTDFLEGRYSEVAITEGEESLDGEEMAVAITDDSDPGLGSRSGAGRSSPGRSSAGKSSPGRSVRSDDDDLTLMPDDSPVRVSLPVPTKPQAPKPKSSSPKTRPKLEPAAAAPSVSIFDELVSSSLSSASSSGNSVLDGPLPAAETLVGPASTTGGSSSGMSASSTSPSLALLEKARAHREEEAEYGINYPLWFLVIAGLILGFILVGVGFSYVTSFKENKQEFKAEQREVD